MIFSVILVAYKRHHLLMARIKWHQLSCLMVSFAIFQLAGRLELTDR